MFRLSLFYMKSIKILIYMQLLYAVIFGGELQKVVSVCLLLKAPIIQSEYTYISDFSVTVIFLLLCIYLC